MNPVKSKTKSNSMAPLLGGAVLIADRNPSAQKPLKDELNSLGVRNIESVTDLGELMRATKKSYDIIFLDSHFSEKRSAGSILEELRLLKVPSKTMIFVISNDRSSGFLQMLIEHEPDEYIIKPYSAEDVSKKIIKAYQRKKTLLPIDELSSAGKVGDALEAAERLSEDFPQYRKEIFKKKIGCLVKNNQDEKAQELLRQQVVKESHPWMEVALAKSLIAQGELEEADSWLRKALNTMPEYSDSADTLAMLLHSQGKSDEALMVLEGLGAAGQGSVRRLRFMHGLAAIVGNRQLEKTLINKAIDRSGYGLLAEVRDYHRLALMYCDEGRIDEAIQSCIPIRQFADPVDIEVIEPLVRINAALKNGEEGKAREILFALGRKIDLREPSLSCSACFELAKACLQLGKESAAEKYLGYIKDRKHDFYFQSEIDALASDIDEALREKKLDSEGETAPRQIESKPVLDVGSARVNGDLAKKLQGVLATPGGQ